MHRRFGTRPTALAIALLALLAAAAVGAVIAATGRPGMSVAIAAIGVGLALNLLLALWIVRVLLRIERSQHDVGTRLDRQRDVIHKTRELVLDVRKRHGQDRSQRAPERLAQLAQIQETVRLFSTIPVQAQVPAMGGWAASPDLVGALVDEFIARRPTLVVECGSGVSTLWLALAARHHQIPIRIVALDHDPVFAAKTRATLERHGVADLAEVRDAPLVTITVEGRDTLWYDRAASADLADIGLLFVDGPPTATGPLARYPALPVLREQLAAKCSIVLDDMIRADEQEVARQWEQTLPDFDRTDLSLEKGATIFRRD